MLDVEEAVQLADWRRQVAEIYARWRAESTTDPEAARYSWRNARDELFRSHPQTPLPLDERARFGGLSYFEYDPAYRMTAVLEPIEEAPPESSAANAFGAALVQLPTSGNEPFSFHRVGKVTLTGPLAGKTLPVFWMEGYAGGLFLPFRDATSGTDTYAAGRYLLDTVKGADQGSNVDTRELMLDFNLAYHPSCTYDPKWNCPLAPAESRLDVPVRAGERLASSAGHT
jgi:hypothetical protein